MPALLLLLLCTSCGEEGLVIRTYTEEETETVQKERVDGTGTTTDTGTKDREGQETRIDTGRQSEGGTGQRSEGGTGQRSGTDETEVCVVYVCGAVVKEGVYSLPEKSRVCDAVDAAGGLREDAAGHAVNLARPVSDGEQIYIPTEAEAEAGTFSEGTGSSEAKESGTDTRININTAGKDELTTLTGIGPGRAADIITYRDRNGRFEKPEDLMQVPGIKEGTYNKLKDQIRVD